MTKPRMKKNCIGCLAANLFVNEKGETVGACSLGYPTRLDFKPVRGWLSDVMIPLAICQKPRTNREMSNATRYEESHDVNS